MRTLLARGGRTSWASCAWDGPLAPSRSGSPWKAGTLGMEGRVPTCSSICLGLGLGLLPPLLLTTECSFLLVALGSLQCRVIASGTTELRSPPNRSHCTTWPRPRASSAASPSPSVSWCPWPSDRQGTRRTGCTGRRRCEDSPRGRAAARACCCCSLPCSTGRTSLSRGR